MMPLIAIFLRAIICINAVKASAFSARNINVSILGGGNVGTILAQKLIESNKFESVKIAARNYGKTCKEVEAKGLAIYVGSISDVLPSSQVSGNVEELLIFLVVQYTIIIFEC